VRVVGLFAALLATSWRREDNEVKYRAEPKPVRRAEGRVPRQRLVMGLGPLRMERRTGKREEDRDCCTRVLRRSAGWRRMALETPEVRPARKWKVGWGRLRWRDSGLGTSRVVVGMPWDISCERVL